MPSTEIVSGLCAFEGRTAGTDAERRAGLWLADELEDTGRKVLIETFWCRPNWALAHVWHAIAALAGSLVSVSHPRTGGAILLVTLLSTVLDWVFGISLGRMLTLQRASQNIIGLPPRGTRDRRVSLILTAPYDAGRAGLADRGRIRGIATRLRGLTAGRAPGWLFWFALAEAWLLAVAIARYEGAGSALIGILQLLPTVGLVLIAALLLELAGADAGPAADGATAVAAVLEVAAALDDSPLGEAAVHVVLTGAGDRSAAGLQRYLRARRRSMQDTNTVVVGLAPCGDGAPRYWRSDGALLPVATFRPLRRLCESAAAEQPELGLAPYRGRGTAPSFPARMSGIPSVTLGSLDDSGLTLRSRRGADTPDTVDPRALERTVEATLLVCDEIDGFLAQMPVPPPEPPGKPGRRGKTRRAPQRGRLGGGGFAPRRRPKRFK